MSYQQSAVSSQQFNSEIRNLQSAIRNEKGIALVMVLVLSAILLAIMAGLIYMVTVGTQISGLEKRYKTAFEAGMGGTEITYQVIATRIDDPVTLESKFSYLSNFDVTATLICLNDKLTQSTDTWDASCSNTINIKPADPTTYDMSFALGAGPTYNVYAKIVDTVEGNSGADLGLEKGGVVSAEFGEITVQSRPYLYTIEVSTENPTNPDERAKLSILYQY